MGKFSRNKGVRGERELASKLRELGIDGAYRSRQFCGSASSADVIGIPGIHKLLLITRSRIMLRLSRDAGESEEIRLSFTDLSSENAKSRTKSTENMTLLLTF